MPDSLHDKANKPTLPPISTPVPLSGVEVTDDDPEISWDLWNKAIADLDASAQSATADTQPVALDTYLATQPAGLEDKTPDQRKADAIALIERQHPKIAGAIRATWGFKECAAFVNKLVLSGSDDMGHTRVGFSPQVVDALMRLADLHETQFGRLGVEEELGFGDFSVRSGLDGAR